MTKAEQARILRWAGGEPRQVARTCRHFGISRTAFYRWKKRFDELGEAGLADRPPGHHAPAAFADADPLVWKCRAEPADHHLSIVSYERQLQFHGQSS